MIPAMFHHGQNKKHLFFKVSFLHVREVDQISVLSYCPWFRAARFFNRCIQVLDAKSQSFVVIDTRIIKLSIWGESNNANVW